MNPAENDYVKIDKISIEQFRRFKNVEFDIGKNITLIAGQNATSKSTLLGMLCQPFSFGVRKGPDNSAYTDNYHGINLAEHHDITGSAFFYDCEDVFRLSSLHDTISKKYTYRLHISGNCISRNSPIFSNGLFVRAVPRKEKGKKERIRFVTGPGASHEIGEGNFPHPVIYLGLNRLWPLALSKKLEVKDTPEMTEEDEKWYIGKCDEILVLGEHDNTTELLKTGIGPKEDFIGASSSDYNSESCSAGQDNLGQILTAILSFRHLKSKLGCKYQGGVLLIDEMDATFHAIAQIRVIETLLEVSEELNLQIIATTHSLPLLKEAFHSGLKRDIKVLYLKKHNKNIVDSGFTSYEQLKDNLYADTTPVSNKKIKKVSVFLEDSVSRNMFLSIVGSSGRGISKYLNRLEMKSFDAGSLKNLAALSEKVPELKNVIFIPDGDVKEELKGHKNCKNIVFLPGESRPETLLYNNLKETDDNHKFWETCKSKFNTYNSQVAITKHGTPPTPTTSPDAKQWYKKWYQEQSQFWGQMDSIAYKKWGSENKNKCKSFCDDFFKILKRVSSENIPKSLFTKILEKYK
ncbi:MAG: AAA family ATPase [Candidatus Anammoxibacter sp.]